MSDGVGVSAPKTYTTDHIYKRRKTGRQEVQGETSTSALRRRGHLSPFVCGAVKTLTDACTVRGQSEEIKCHSIGRYGAVLSKSSCAGFSHPPLWWFPQA